MMVSNQKYANPASVLQSLVDDYGKQIQLGDQKDIGEFNLNLLERIEEGLGEVAIKDDVDMVDEDVKMSDGVEGMHRQSSMVKVDSKKKA
jgi:hypothetical protein